MRRIYLIVTCMMLAASQCAAQYSLNQNKHWAFGFDGGLDFTSGSPVPETSSMTTSEACASVSDASGNLLFYTNGNEVWNKLGAVMPSGSSLMPYISSSATQGTLIVPVLGTTTQYYVFSIEEIEDYLAGDFTGPHMYYSIVDMSLDGGLGDVVTTETGIAMPFPVSEKMMAVAGNNCDIWLMLHGRDTTTFMAYDITSSGISTTPVVSNVGYMHGFLSYDVGVMKVSPNRNKIVAENYESFVSYSDEETLPNDVGAELYDFDPSTGIVSNAIMLDTGDLGYGAEFSPDGTKLYTHKVGSGFTTSAGVTITQYDISSGVAATIIASKYIVATNDFGVYTDLKLGPDGKIYLTNLGYDGKLDCISSPNSSGAACNYISDAVTLTSGSPELGYPNVFVTVAPGDTTYASSDTVLCIPTGDSAYISAPSGYAGYLWNTGATGSSLAVHTPGTYWVYCTTSCSVLIDTVYVMPSPIGDTTIKSTDTSVCTPFSKVLVAPSGYPTYLWSTGSVTPSISISDGGTYFVLATNGCSTEIDTFVYNASPYDTVFHSSIQELCFPMSQTLYGTPGYATYTWSDGATSTNTHTVTDTGLFYMTGVIGCSVEQDSFHISAVNTTFNVFNSPDTAICYGASVPIHIDGSPEFVYSWRPIKNVSDATITSPVITPDSSGTWTVTGVHDGCPSQTFAITINVEQPTVNIVPIDTEMCLFAPMQIEAVAYPQDSVLTYSWMPAAYLTDGAVLNPYFYDTASGTHKYVLTVTTQLGCSNSDSVTIVTAPHVRIVASPADTQIKYGTTILLDAQNLNPEACIWMWTPDNGTLDNPNIHNPYATPIDSATYTVIGTNAFGCRDSATVKIGIDYSMDESLPTAFTPNGDGKNDVFRLIGMKYQRLLDFRVFNRWGVMVFHTTDVKNGWDGTYQGAPQDMGVYNYAVIVARPDGSEKTYTGNVTLIR